MTQVDYQELYQKIYERMLVDYKYFNIPAIFVVEEAQILCDIANRSDLPKKAVFQLQLAVSNFEREHVLKE